MPRESYDDRKVKHANKTRAVEEMKRLRSDNNGQNGTERLNVYYSRDTGGWHVGKMTKRDYGALHGGWF
jgi:hypothetical protein